MKLGRAEFGGGRHVVRAVLVTGCGNSSLCEDLYKAQVRDIHAMDYSGVVVEQMQQRATRLGMEGSIRYFEVGSLSIGVILCGYVHSMPEPLVTCISV